MVLNFANFQTMPVKSIIFLVIVMHIGSLTNAQTVRIEYIAHASFKLSYHEKSLLIDPFADTIWIGYKFPKNITADAVLITHPHYDHDGGRFRGIEPYWEDQLQIIEEAGTYTIGEFKITGLKGKHSDPYGKEFGQKNIIWLIEVAGLKLVHLGDNGPLTLTNYNAIGTPDILFVPIDSDFHILKADELEVVLNMLNPKIIVPMHYRLPDLEKEGFPKGGLGEIDPYLDGKDVSKLKGNSELFGKTNLPDDQQIIVFQHSIDVKK